MSAPELEYTGYPHYSFVHKFETGITPEWVQQWFKNNWHYSLYLALVYLISIFGLQRYMKNRNRVKVRKAVIVWDFSLAVFSICGMLRTVPEIIHILKNFGMEYSVCNTTMNSVTLFWSMAFVLSKAPELLDTFFIVLKKQKLTTLHLSHHVLTMLFCWVYAKNMPAAGRWIIAMNYSVHSLMYSYFTLKAAKFNIPIKFSMIMTTVQIVQMVVGILAAAFSLKANIQGHECTTSATVSVIGMSFGLYLMYMFIKFFLYRYKVLKVDPKKKR